MGILERNWYFNKKPNGISRTEKYNVLEIKSFHWVDFRVDWTLRFIKLEDRSIAIIKIEVEREKKDGKTKLNQL